MGIWASVLWGAVLVALITPTGTPAKLLTATPSGAFELIVSASCSRTSSWCCERKVPSLRQPRCRQSVGTAAASRRGDGRLPVEPPPIPCTHTDDNYLIALVHSRSAALISGDGHLLELAGKIPIFTPCDFVAAQDQ
jgi:predicted nucleic acid-binding protein